MAPNAYCTTGTTALRVIDAYTGAAVTTVTMAASTYAAAVSPDGTQVAVSFNGTQVQFVATASNTAGSAFTVGAGMAAVAGLAWAPDSSKVYVTGTFSGGGGAQSVTPAGGLGTVWSFPNHISGSLPAIAVDGSKLYLPCAGAVRQLDTTSGTVTATYAQAGSFYQVCITPNGLRLYVSDPSGTNVYPVTIAGGVVGAGVNVGGAVYGLCASPDGSTVWCGVYGANAVKTIATASNTVTHTISVTTALGVGVTPDGSQVWASNFGANTVFPISAATFTAGSAVTLSGNVRTIGIVPASAGVSGTAAVTAGPLTVTTSGRVTVGGGGGCVRSGWLTLPGTFLALEDPTAGYFCSSLDLGYPTPRDVVTNRPDQGGATDRTQWLGIRTINVQIEAIQGAGARVDQVAARFGPYLDPAARPVLHYVLDRDTNPERAITVRAAGFAWPIQGPYQRSIQLQFVAADPVAYDPTVRTATATVAVPATLTTAGDLPARPRIRVTGPVTAPAVTLTPASGSPWQLNFLASFTVAAGHYVDVDTAARTVLADGDLSQPRLSSIDWTVSSWQSIPPATATTLALAGTATSGATQAQAVWNDGYLT